MSKILFLLNGPTNGGKGTWENVFKLYSSVPIVVGGEICRSEKDADSPRWQKALAYMTSASSTFWPDDLMIEALMEHLRMGQVAASHLILDALPYTLTQTEAIMPIMNEFGFNRLVSLEIVLDDDECIRRAALRKRYDDHKIRERLADFHSHTEPALDAVMRLSNETLKVERIVFEGKDMKINASRYAIGLMELYGLN